MVTDLGYRRNRTFDPRENIVQERQSGWTGCIFEPLELVGRLGGKAARMMLLVGRQNVGAEVPGRGDLRPARRLLVGEESDQWRIERNRGEAAHDHSVTRTLVRRGDHADARRSEEHTSELQSLMRISYAVFCLKKKTKKKTT